MPDRGNAGAIAFERRCDLCEFGAEYLKALEDRAFLDAKVFGTICSVYKIPSAEIDEIRERVKEESKIEDIKKANERKAAKKRFNKLMPKFKVIHRKGVNANE